MSTLGLSDTLTIDTLEAGDVTTHVDGVRGYLRDTWLLVERSLQTLRRVPMRLSDVTIQPVMFTFLFLYVFGSAIDIPGIRYQDYLLPGLIGRREGTCVAPRHRCPTPPVRGRPARSTGRARRAPQRARVPDGRGSGGTAWRCRCRHAGQPRHETVRHRSRGSARWPHRATVGDCARRRPAVAGRWFPTSGWSRNGVYSSVSKNRRWEADHE